MDLKLVIRIVTHPFRHLFNIYMVKIRIAMNGGISTYMDKNEGNEIVMVPCREE